MARGRLKLAAAFMLVLVAYPLGRWLRNARRWESPTQCAHRICEQCGLNPVVVEGLIETMQHSTLTREQSLELFFSTFEEPGDAEMCLSCAEAVLTAAGAMILGGSAAGVAPRVAVAGTRESVVFRPRSWHNRLYREGCFRYHGR